jgi:hypothetical protein
MAEDRFSDNEPEMSGEEANPARADEASAGSGSTGGTPADEASAGSRSTAGAPADDGVLSRLEERLDRASETAERLLAQAAQRATRKVPPAGWQQAEPAGGRGSAGGGQGSSGGRHGPGGSGHGSGDTGGDSDGTGSDWLLGGEVDLLLGILASFRDRIPAELQQRLADALREVLLAVRALIDWYLERSERRRRQPAEVQDIPIL